MSTESVTVRNVEPATVSEPEQRGRLLWQTLAGLVLRAAGIAIAFLSQIVIARALGVTEFGIYVTVLAWATLLSLLPGLGMPQAAIRFLSTYREQQDWRAYRGFVHATARSLILSGVLVGLGATAVFAFVPALRAALPAMAVAAILIPFFAASSLAQGATVAAQRPLQAEGVNGLLRGLVTVATVGGLALLHVPLDAGTVVALTVLAAMVTLAVQVAAWSRSVASPWHGPVDRSAIGTWRASGRAYLISTVAIALTERLDTILLGILASPAEVGPYAVASRFSLLIGVALTPIAALAGAAAARALAKGDQAELQRMMAQMALLSGGCGMVLASLLLFGGPHLLRMFGPGFADAWSILGVLTIGQLALTLAGAAGGLLAVAGRNRALIGIMLATAALDLTLCVLLIPAHGAMGAAIATAVSLSCNALALAIAARILLGVDTTILGGFVMVARRIGGSRG